MTQPVLDRKKNGYITIFIVTIVGSIIMLTALSFSLLEYDNIISSKLFYQSERAKGVVNACAEKALEQIRENVNYQGNGSLSFDYGNCFFTVSNLGGLNRNIIASSTVSGIIRKVSININQINPKLNVLSWQEVANF